MYVIVPAIIFFIKKSPDCRGMLVGYFDSTLALPFHCAKNNMLKAEYPHKGPG